MEYVLCRIQKNPIHGSRLPENGRLQWTGPFSVYIYSAERPRWLNQRKVSGQTQMAQDVIRK